MNARQQGTRPAETVIREATTMRRQVDHHSPARARWTAP
jgi:hypothetical protein